MKVNPALQQFERMRSPRKIIYYTIIATSILWIIGTIAFMFLDDIEVTVAVKRRVADAVSKSLAETIKFIPKREKQHRVFDRFDEFENQKVILANYEHKLVERDQDLPGELGRGVSVGPGEKEKEKLGYEKHAFNQLVSDKISIHRSLKDYRNDK